MNAKKKKRLGRGLDALLGGSIEQANAAPAASDSGAPEPLGTVVEAAPKVMANAATELTSFILCMFL